MSILKRLQSVPTITKFILNRYAPYRGAGIQVEKIDFPNYHIRVTFYMLLLMHHLGSKYIVWDKAAKIQFLSPGRGTVYADIRIDAAEIKQIKTLAEDYSPVNRIYQLSIYDEAGVRIAEVEKTVYIRRKKAKPDLK